MGVKPGTLRQNRLKHHQILSQGVVAPATGLQQGGSMVVESFNTQGTNQGHGRMLSINSNASAGGADQNPAAA